MRSVLNKHIDNYSNSLTGWLKRISFPGFEGVPVYEVGVFFIRGLVKGSLTTRAAAISFSFFMALFPLFIFFFSLIAYVSEQSVQQQIISLLESFMPQNAFDALRETITDIISRQRHSLLSFGFLAALIFSTNGINRMIDAFNDSIHCRETRSWYIRRLTALFLVLIVTALLALAIGLIVFGSMGLQQLKTNGYIQHSFEYYTFVVIKWTVTLALFFFAISFLYYVAPAKHGRWKFFSLGATVATIFAIVASKAFSFYVNNFGQYNKLYGSIGTIIVILMWIYVNAIVLLVGFELNVSIKNAHQSRKMEDD